MESIALLLTCIWVLPPLLRALVGLPFLLKLMISALALVPLGGGVGAELGCPLGFTIVGGLIVSQALTLFTTPVMYLYLDRLRWKLMRRGGRQPWEMRDRAGLEPHATWLA